LSNNIFHCLFVLLDGPLTNIHFSVDWKSKMATPEDRTLLEKKEKTNFHTN